MQWHVILTLIYKYFHNSSFIFLSLPLIKAPSHKFQLVPLWDIHRFRRILITSYIFWHLLRIENFYSPKWIWIATMHCGSKIIIQQQIIIQPCTWENKIISQELYNSTSISHLLVFQMKTFKVQIPSPKLSNYEKKIKIKISLKLRFMGCDHFSCSKILLKIFYKIIA